MSVSYPHARRHDRPHARGGEPRDGSDRAVNVVVIAHGLARAHGRRCRGGGLGPRAEAGKGNARLSHTCSPK